jgi:protein-S-isoprenylcysteine O-methyltransferase Ste14
MLWLLSCIGAGMANSDPRRFPFPPAIPVIALLASWGLGQVWPIAVPWPNWTFWAGLALFTLPHLLGIWAHRTFLRHRTTVNPRGDVAEIMTDGPFRYTRNPMYLSLMPLYVGGSLLFRLPWAWILLLPVFVVLNFGVIVPEEKYLEAKFGAKYLRYKQRVRRWL